MVVHERSDGEVGAAEDQEEIAPEANARDSIQSKLAHRRHLFEAAAPEERPFKV